METNDRIKDKAAELGFDLFGVAPAGPASDGRHFENWLKSGRQADMRWIERNVEKRIDPLCLHPTARSVVSVGLSYFTGNPPDTLWNDPLRGRVARFAWGPDYHDLITPKLRALARFIDMEFTLDPPSRYFVDTGPVLERYAAVRAGLGSIGYNTSLINPDYGSYVFIGEIITGAEMEYAEPRAELAALCSECRACLGQCPTGALQDAYICDSRRCISYLTIENSGVIPLELRAAMGNWVFGCDTCQSCCPLLESIAAPHPDHFLEYDPLRHSPQLEELLILDEASFRQRYRGTPVIRAKRQGMRRNAAVALGNSESEAAIQPLEAALSYCEDDVLADHIGWALKRLGERSK